MWFYMFHSALLLFNARKIVGHLSKSNIQRFDLNVEQTYMKWTSLLSIL